MSLASLTRLVRLPRSFAKRHPWAEKSQLGHPHGPMLPSTHAFSSPDKGEASSGRNTEKNQSEESSRRKSLRLSREHLVSPALRRHSRPTMLGIPACFVAPPSGMP